MTHVLERTFSATGGVALLRRSTLKNWPPRYATGEPTLYTPSETEAVSESELAVEAPRVRVRTLLKPEPAKKRRRVA